MMVYFLNYPTVLKFVIRYWNFHEIFSGNSDNFIQKQSTSTSTKHHYLFNDLGANYLR